MINLDRLEQVCIEDTYDRTQTKSVILKDIEKGLDEPIAKAVLGLYEYFDKTYSYESKNTRIDEYLSNNIYEPEKIINEILIAVLPTKSNISIQSVVGKLATTLGYENQWDGIKTAAEIITVVSKSGLYDMIPARESISGSIEIKSNFRLEDITLQTLSQMQYLPPLICKPVMIIRNYQSAYLCKEESIILGSGNHHNKPLGLDAINIANSVALSLDPWVLSQEEESKKPLDTQEKVDNFTRLKNSSRRVYNELLDLGNKFYLSWKFDKRGRMYSSGYHVNIQSTEYKKALINLATPQVIRLD